MRDPAHAVPDDLENALKARGRHNVQQLLGQRTLHPGRIADGLHVFVGVFHLDTHQLIDKIVKACAVGGVEQKAEFVEVVVHIVHERRRAAVGIR